eukprot:Gb_23372 [translate_table: standard]
MQRCRNIVSCFIQNRVSLSLPELRVVYGHLSTSPLYVYKSTFAGKLRLQEILGVAKGNKVVTSSSYIAMESYLFQRTWPPFWKCPNAVEGHMKDSVGHMRRICWAQAEMENALERDPPKKRLDGSSPTGSVSCGEAMDVRKMEK